MIAQDTGSAIVGPARADLYFGAGLEAGQVAGRLRHGARFVMLVPKSLDPMARARKMPLPDDRPSATIAKLFPQTVPTKDQKNAAKLPDVTATTGVSAAATPVVPPAAGTAQSSAVQAAAAAKPVPLPEPRPIVKPVSAKPHQRHLRRYRTFR
jgi:membrane-bound lytic murein transglycosylase A